MDEKNIIKIFGDNMFDDGPHAAHLSKDYVTIDLTCMLSDEDIELERVFPKDEFKH